MRFYCGHSQLVQPGPQIRYALVALDHLMIEQTRIEITSRRQHCLPAPHPDAAKARERTTPSLRDSSRTEPVLPRGYTVSPVRRANLRSSRPAGELRRTRGRSSVSVSRTKGLRSADGPGVIAPGCTSVER